MKKETNSVYIDKNMNTLTTSVNDWVLNTLSSVIKDEDISSVRSALENNKKNIEKVLTKKKVEKKIKDINAPKRPKSSYIFFCLDKRSEIKESIPNIAAKDILIELGLAWGLLSEDGKFKYVKLALKDKERYNKEIKNYKDRTTGAEPDTRFGRAGRSPTQGGRSPTQGPPKQIDEPDHLRSGWAEPDTRSASDEPDQSEKVVSKTTRRHPRSKCESSERYKGFWQAHKEDIKDENPEFSVVQVNDYIRDMWNEMSEKDKEYWKNRMIPPRIVKKRKKDPRGNGYMLFAREERKNFKVLFPGVSNHKLNKAIGKGWQSLSEKERVNYEDRSIKPVKSGSVRQVHLRSEPDTRSAQ